MTCRHCGSPVSLSLMNLGAAPPSSAYLSEKDLNAPECWYPLRVRVCENCWLAQTEGFAKRETLFASDYAYFGSVEDIRVADVDRYSKAMIELVGLDTKSLVVEIATNDGCSLEAFKRRGIPVLGVEPTFSTAAAGARTCSSSGCRRR